MMSCGVDLSLLIGSLFGELSPVELSLLSLHPFMLILNKCFQNVVEHDLDLK